jgi:hypothetical protein
MGMDDYADYSARRHNEKGFLSKIGETFRLGFEK